MKHLKTLLGLVITVTLALSTAQAQTAGKIIDDTSAALKAAWTNAYWEAHYMRAPSLPQKNGGGIGAFWVVNSLDSTNVSARLLAGTRVDWVNGGFWMPSGNVTIDLPIHPLAWTGWAWAKSFTVVPIGYAGLGIPLSGAKFGSFTIPGKATDNNGQATAITGYGIAVELAKLKKMDLSLAYDRETWAGFPGTQYRIGAVIKLHY